MTDENQRGDPLLRVSALAVLWVMVNAWTSVHLGLNLSDLSAVNSLLVAFGAILAFLPESKRRRVESEGRRRRERLADRLLDGRMILALYLVFFVAGSFLSSIRIEAGRESGVEGSAVVRIAREDGDGKEMDLGTGAQVARLLRLTAYGGKEVRLAANLPTCRATVETKLVVRPWRPAVLRLDRLECPPEPPTVVLRLPDTARIYLRGAGVYLVCNRTERSGFATSEGNVWYRIGPAMESGESAVAVEEPPCWKSGQTLDAVLCTRAQTPVAHAEIEVPAAGTQQAKLVFLSDGESRKHWQPICRLPF